MDKKMYCNYNSDKEKKWFGMKHILYFSFAVYILLFLTGCADSVNYNIEDYKEPVGFFYGFWHGLISPIAFIISLFDKDVAIYAVYNNGSWYDFGFLLGCAFFSGTSIEKNKK